jgi:hypothetical protein
MFVRDFVGLVFPCRPAAALAFTEFPGSLPAATTSSRAASSFAVVSAPPSPSVMVLEELAAGRESARSCSQEAAPAGLFPPPLPQHLCEGCEDSPTAVSSSIAGSCAAAAAAAGSPAELSPTARCGPSAGRPPLECNHFPSFSTGKFPVVFNGKMTGND